MSPPAIRRRAPVDVPLRTRAMPDDDPSPSRRSRARRRGGRRLVRREDRPVGSHAEERLVLGHPAGAGAARGAAGLPRPTANPARRPPELVQDDAASGHPHAHARGRRRPDASARDANRRGLSADRGASGASPRPVPDRSTRSEPGLEDAVRRATAARAARGRRACAARRRAGAPRRRTGAAGSERSATHIADADGTAATAGAARAATTADDAVAVEPPGAAGIAPAGTTRGDDRSTGDGAHPTGSPASRPGHRPAGAAGDCPRMNAFPPPWRRRSMGGWRTAARESGRGTPAM